MNLSLFQLPNPFAALCHYPGWFNSIVCITIFKGLFPKFVISFPRDHTSRTNTRHWGWCLQKSRSPSDLLYNILKIPKVHISMCVYIVRASYSCHVPSEDTAVQQTFDGTNTYTDNMNEQMTFKKSVVQRETARYCLILHDTWDIFCNPYSLLSKRPLSLRCRCLQVLVVLSRKRRSGLPKTKSPRKKIRAKLTAAMAPSLQHPRPCIVSKLQWKASAKCRIDSSSQKLNVFCLPKVWTSFNIQDQCSLVPNHDFWALGFYLENLHTGPRNLPRSTSFGPHRCQPGRNIVHWNDQPFHAQRLETRTGRCKGFGRWISFQTESSSGFIVSFRGNKSSLFFKGKGSAKPLDLVNKLAHGRCLSTHRFTTLWDKFRCQMANYNYGKMDTSSISVSII